MDNRGVLGAATEGRTLEEILGWIDRGELRLPEFSRPFVWGPEQRLDLFESVERNFPIGSVIILETTDDLPSLPDFAGVRLPDTTEVEGVFYLLDGHQRLATLYGGLRRRANDHETVGQDAPWRVYRELGASGQSGNLYRRWESEAPVPTHFLPMSAVLRTMDFLAFARELDSHRQDLPVDELISEAEEIAQRFKSYRLPVVRLRGGSLGQAMRVFQRLNSSGRSLTKDEIRRASTWGPESCPTSAERISQGDE
ncbi:DUF262 domain-containing protein [Nocardiopsis lucentensis]|uniref:DUF262 domain-containing protein n=1 Tax=Nocardiopsis lucentensis TaxID=53441 RepID=UPI0003456CFB|nr:DUF262 domain-containing protein [Nocardiopsis lucentensis]